jgi:hypothetical protein
VSFHPRRQNVQETRSGFSRHARFGGSYGLENRCNGTRRRLVDYGEWFIASAANTVQERQFAGTADAVQKRLVTGTTNALLKTGQYPQK